MCIKWYDDHPASFLYRGINPIYDNVSQQFSLGNYMWFNKWAIVYPFMYKIKDLECV